MMQMQVIGVQRYDMVTDDGVQIKGTKVHVVDSEINEKDRKGLFAASFSADYSLFEAFNKVPALYDIDFAIKPGSKGGMKINGATLIREQKPLKI